MEIEMKKILRISIDHSFEEKPYVLQYLDEQFDETGYSIKRSGPATTDRHLMIVEVDWRDLV